MLKSNNYAHQEMIRQYGDEIIDNPKNFLNSSDIFGISDKKQLFQEYDNSCSGRDGHYWPPPAQIRTSGFPACGSSFRSITTRYCILSDPVSDNRVNVSTPLAFSDDLSCVYSDRYV